MKIAIDIDGVLTNLEEYFKEYICKYKYENNINTSIDISKYYIKDSYGLNQDQINDFFKKYFKYYENDWSARTFSSEVIKKLKEDGNKIYIITSRYEACNDDEKGKKIRKRVVKWLKKNKIYYDYIYYTNDGKKDVCKKLGIDIMIDDAPKNINEVSKVCKVICFDARYNKECNGDNIIRCYSWYDIYSKIKELY